MSLEKNGVEQAPAIERESRIKHVARFAGKNLLKGLFVGLGFAVPVTGGLVYVSNHVEANLKSTKDETLEDFQQRADETGNRWIITFKEENTEELRGPLEGINSKLPDTTTTTSVPDIDEKDEAIIASDTKPEQSTTTTTVPPQE